MDIVAWNKMEQCLDAVHRSSKARFARLVKFMMDVTHTSAQKHKFTSKMEYIPTVTNLCPCCRMEEYSSIHLYQFQHPQIRYLLLKGLDSIEDKLQQKETPSDVWMTIRAGIGEYCGFLSTIPEPSTSDMTGSVWYSMHKTKSAGETS